MHKESMISYLPKYERNSKIFQEHFNGIGIELDQRDITINDIKKQLSINTATWGLSIYEEELGIPNSPNKPLEERRSVIKSKSRGTGKVDAALIKMVVDAFTNGSVSVDFIGKIKVTFNDIKGIPPNIEDVYKSIEEIKPTHLAVLYRFKYLVISEMNTIRIADLDTMTLNDFENYQ